MDIQQEIYAIGLPNETFSFALPRRIPPQFDVAGQNDERDRQHYTNNYTQSTDNPFIHTFTCE
jgi:hypothetical protein